MVSLCTLSLGQKTHNIFCDILSFPMVSFLCSINVLIVTFSLRESFQHFFTSTMSSTVSGEGTETEPLYLSSS